MAATQYLVHQPPGFPRATIWIKVDRGWYDEQGTRVSNKRLMTELEAALLKTQTPVEETNHVQTQDQKSDPR